MNNILISLNVMLPVFLTILIGVLLRKAHLLPKSMTKDLNNLCFKCFLPLLLFNNIRSTDFRQIFDLRLISFALISILIMFTLLCWIIPKLVVSPAQQSVVIQGFYRSNYVILGIPIIGNIYGADNIAVITMLVAVVVPVFNVMAVLLFEKFKGGNRYDLKNLLLGIATNPLIIGSVLGLVCNAMHLAFPTAINQTIASISGIALPLALLILGADLDLSARTTNYGLLAFTVLGRLIIIPALFLPIAVLFGFRGQALASLTILYAAPSAVSGYVMAQNAHADYHLAGQIVAITSLLSCFTLFIIIALEKHFTLI